MPFEISLDVDPDLWHIAQVLPLPPVSTGHAGGGHPPQQRSDTVRLSKAAEILQLAEDGQQATTIAHTLGLPVEDVVVLLSSGRDPNPTPHLAQPIPPSASVATPVESSRPVQTVLVEATRDANGNLVPTPVPIAIATGEAPPLAGPSGMPLPTVERRYKRRRRKDRRSTQNPLWRWPLSESIPNSPAPTLDPWRHLEENDIIDSAAHEWTDATGTPIPGGRLALPQPIATVPSVEIPQALPFVERSLDASV